MARAVAVAAVTAGEKASGTVAASDATRSAIHIVNLSGGEVDLYIDGSLFETLDAIGPNARFDGGADYAPSAFAAICRTRPLSLLVTKITY